MDRRRLGGSHSDVLAGCRPARGVQPGVAGLSPSAFIDRSGSWPGGRAWPDRWAASCVLTGPIRASIGPDPVTGSVMLARPSKAAPSWITRTPAYSSPRIRAVGRSSTRPLPRTWPSTCPATTTARPSWLRRPGQAPEPQCRTRASQSRQYRRGGRPAAGGPAQVVA